MNDKSLDIIAFPRGDDWVAQVEHDPATWECGKNRDEAIGKLWSTLKSTSEKYNPRILIEKRDTKKIAI